MCVAVKRKSFILSDFNARVGKSNDADDVIGMFGEDSCNSNGNLQIELLHNNDLMICMEEQC